MFDPLRAGKKHLTLSRPGGFLYRQCEALLV